MKPFNPLVLSLLASAALVANATPFQSPNVTASVEIGNVTANDADHGVYIEASKPKPRPKGIISFPGPGFIFSKNPHGDFTLRYTQVANNVIQTLAIDVLLEAVNGGKTTTLARGLSVHSNLDDISLYATTSDLPCGEHKLIIIEHQLALATKKYSTFRSATRRISWMCDDNVGASNSTTDAVNVMAEAKRPSGTLAFPDAGLVFNQRWHGDFTLVYNQATDTSVRTLAIDVLLEAVEGGKTTEIAHGLTVNSDTADITLYASTVDLTCGYYKLIINEYQELWDTFPVKFIKFRAATRRIRLRC